jgi:hypothetical protein
VRGVGSDAGAHPGNEKEVAVLIKADVQGSASYSGSKRPSSRNEKKARSTGQRGSTTEQSSWPKRPGAIATPVPHLKPAAPAKASISATLIIMRFRRRRKAGHGKIAPKAREKFRSAEVRKSVQHH